VRTIYIYLFSQLSSLDCRESGGGITRADDVNNVKLHVHLFDFQKIKPRWLIKQKLSMIFIIYVGAYKSKDTFKTCTILLVLNSMHVCIYIIKYKVFCQYEFVYFTAMFWIKLLIKKQHKKDRWAIRQVGTVVLLAASWVEKIAESLGAVRASQSAHPGLRSATHTACVLKPTLLSNWEFSLKFFTMSLALLC